MKTKNILLVIIALCAVNSAFALKITVYNASDFIIEVDPLWRGNPRGFSSISPRSKNNPNPTKDFNSSVHHLQGLFVNLMDNDGNVLQCFFYNFERHNLKGTGHITIAIGQIPFGFDQAIISGQTMAGIGSTKIDRPFGVSGENVRCQ